MRSALKRVIRAGGSAPRSAGPWSTRHGGLAGDDLDGVAPLDHKREGRLRRVGLHGSRGRRLSPATPGVLCRARWRPEEQAVTEYPQLYLG